MTQGSNGPNYSHLDQQQILQRVFEESADRLRVDATVSLEPGSVTLTDDDDSVAIGNGSGTHVTVTPILTKNALDVNVANDLALTIESTDDSIAIGDSLGNLATITTVGSKSGLDVNLLQTPFVKLQDGVGNSITSQSNSSQRALDVGINVSGVQIDPRQTRAIGSTSDSITLGNSSGTLNTITTVGLKNAIDVNLVNSVSIQGAAGHTLIINDDGSVNTSGLKIAGKITQVTLTDTWQALPATPLANRNALVIQNLCGKDMKINYVNNVAYAGLTIKNGGERSYNITDDIIVYGRSSVSEGLVIAIEEIS